MEKCVKIIDSNNVCSSGDMYYINGVFDIAGYPYKYSQYGPFTLNSSHLYNHAKYNVSTNTLYYNCSVRGDYTTERCYTATKTENEIEWHDVCQ